MPAGRLRLVADDVHGIADVLRQDTIGTTALGETALATLTSPELVALLPSGAAVEVAAELLVVEALAAARVIRAAGGWTFAAGVGTAFDTADAMLETLRPSGLGPVETAWRALLTQLELGIDAAGPGWDGLLGTATALLAGSGVPLRPRLPPATGYPEDWGDPAERRRGFAEDYQAAYAGTAFPPAGMALDGEGRVVPVDTETVLVSAAQAAKLGAPSAAEADGSVIRVVTYETRPPTFVALIPGSAGFGFASPSDWCYNVTGGAPLQAAARDALDRTIADYGAGAGDPPRIGLVGFSQGGIAALGLGAGLGTAYDLVLVETVGTPDLQDVGLPGDARVVAIADQDDPVPRLDGRPNPLGWEDIVVDSGGMGLDAHSELGYARAAAALPDDPIAALATAAGRDPTMTDYFYTMR